MSIDNLGSSLLIVCAFSPGQPVCTLPHEVEPDERAFPSCCWQDYLVAAWWKKNPKKTVPLWTWGDALYSSRKLKAKLAVRYSWSNKWCLFIISQGYEARGRQITVKFKEVKLTCVEITDRTEWTWLIAHQNTTVHIVVQNSAWAVMNE